MPITGLAIAAGLGLAKSEFVDKPKEKRQRKLAAETQRLSPWTGLKADPIQEADPLGTAMKYGVTGAAMGSGIGREKAIEAGKVSPYAPSPYSSFTTPQTIVYPGMSPYLVKGE